MNWGGAQTVPIACRVVVHLSASVGQIWRELHIHVVDYKNTTHLLDVHFLAEIPINHRFPEANNLAVQNRVEREDGE